MGDISDVQQRVLRTPETDGVPDFLLDPRRRAERALVSVVAESYVNGVSTRKVERIAEAMGIDRLSKSRVSEMAKSLDASVESFRHRPLDAGPYLSFAKTPSAKGIAPGTAFWRTTACFAQQGLQYLLDRRLMSPFSG